MKCPSCNTELKMSERSGIEIDYCPQCRGVWLDRGELDKIIERSAIEPSLQQKQAEPFKGDSYSERTRHENEQKQYGKGSHFDQNKRKSFLGDLFDF